MAKTYTMQFGAGDPRNFSGLSPTFLIFANAASGATVAPPAITEMFTGTGIYKFSWGTTTPIAFLADAATTSPGVAGRYVTGSLDPADRADEYGTSMVAIGTTLIGYGVSTLAFGSTLFGQGVSNLAQGVSLNAMGVTLTGFGFSNYAFGQSNIALGVTNQFLIQNLGATLLNFGATLLDLAGLVGSTQSVYGGPLADPTTLFGFLRRAQEFNEGNRSYGKPSGALSYFSRNSATLLIAKTISDGALGTTCI